MSESLNLPRKRRRLNLWRRKQSLRRRSSSSVRILRNLKKSQNPLQKKTNWLSPSWPKFLQCRSRWTKWLCCLTNKSKKLSKKRRRKRSRRRRFPRLWTNLSKRRRMKSPSKLRSSLPRKSSKPLLKKKRKRRFFQADHCPINEPVLYRLTSEGLNLWKSKRVSSFPGRKQRTSNNFLIRISRTL